MNPKSAAESSSRDELSMAAWGPSLRLNHAVPAKHVWGEFGVSGMCAEQVRLL